MRAKIDEMVDGSKISINEIAARALQQNEVGERVGSVIEKIADHESEWYKSSPPHTLKTYRVIQSRETELNAYIESNAAVIAALEFSQQAQTGDSIAQARLRAQLINAVQAIDEAPGATQTKRNLMERLREQLVIVAGKFMLQELKAAESDYLERFKNERLLRYASSQSKIRGSDFTLR